MNYPVIDPVGTGINLKTLITDNGYTIAGIGRKLGIADMSALYKWLRGDTLPGIDNMLAQYSAECNNQRYSGDEIGVTYRSVV